MNQSFTSKDTSVNKYRLPAVYTMKKAVALMEGKEAIDIGGGKYDNAIVEAAKWGTKVSIYDPFNREKAHNDKVLCSTYDVAVISNTLNVIDSKEARKEAIQLASRKAQIILIAVHEGDRSGVGRQTGKDSWQENRKTASYVPEIQEALIDWEVERKGKLIICRK